MNPRLQQLNDRLQLVLGERCAKLFDDIGELTLEVSAADYQEVARTLRDHPELCFEQLMDLCGVDYAAFGEVGETLPDKGAPRRFAAVSHLLSLKHNWRLRLRVFADDRDSPVVASLSSIWNSANWFEREAFDLVGILFDGHADLRRILTDYGFSGHPLRKDFPLSGHLEMRYDPEQKRVAYQPVSIEPRVVTPRIIREQHFGGLPRG